MKILGFVCFESKVLSYFFHPLKLTVIIIILSHFRNGKRQQMSSNKKKIMFDYFKTFQIYI